MKHRASLFSIFVLVSSSGSLRTYAQPTNTVTKVTIPDLPPSFRDVSIELRCDALSVFISTFASEHLDELGYIDMGCSEGNGIGGANYVLEFKFKNVPDIKAYSLQVEIDKKNTPTTKICMQSPNETVCSQSFSQVPANEEPHFSVTKESQITLVNRNYMQPNKKLSALLPTVTSWVRYEQRFTRIFGRDYDTFIKGKIRKPWELPVKIKDKAVRLKVELTPNKSTITEGNLKLLEELPLALRSCLECKDGFCSNLDLQYTFNNKFFAVSGRPHKGYVSESDIEKAKFGLAWVMDGPEPFEKNGSNWRFFCGVSRYSVQIIKN